MPAHSIVSEKQMEILLTFMEENLDLANGRMANTGPLPVARQITKKMWNDLAKKMNSVGISKPAAKWREYWSEKKYSLRRKAKLNRERSIAGMQVLALTACEQRIYNILSKELSVVPKRRPSDPPVPTFQFPKPTPSCQSTPKPTRLSPSPPLPTSPTNTDESTAPQWALNIEERRLALEKRQVDCLERQTESLSVIASSLSSIQAMLALLVKKQDDND